MRLKILEAYHPTFRRRNILTAFGILGWVFGMYYYTIWAVKQEDFLDDEFDKRKNQN